jgi:hypothetical protein
MRRTTPHTERPAAGRSHLEAVHPAAALVQATGNAMKSSSHLQQEAVHQLRMATNPAELLSVQAALLMAGWQQSIQVSTDLANAWFALGAAGALPKAPGKTH